MKNFKQVLEHAKNLKNMRAAVAAAADEEVLEAVEEARAYGIADGILVGDRDKIEAILKNKNINPENFSIIDEKDEDKAVIKSIELVKKKKADFIVKGKIKTGPLMKHIINKDYGILTGDTLSHVLILNPEKTQSFILLSDGGMLIKPTLAEKESIIKNSITVAKALKLNPVKIALLAAAELSDENNAAKDAGLVAAAFRQKYLGGKLKFEIEGPVGLDDAVKAKKSANVFIMPDIETGNIVGKAFMYLAKSDCGLLIIGAKVPIVVTSRADTAHTKLNSIALACLVSKVKVNFN